MPSKRAVQCPVCGTLVEQPAAYCRCGQSLLKEIVAGQVQPLPTPPRTITRPEQSNRDNYAVAGFVLGICSVGFPFLGPLSIPCGLVGLPLSIMGLKSRNRGLAVAGIVLSSICVVLIVLALCFVGVLLSVFKLADTPTFGR